jgi:hypothetical protein
MKAEAVFFERRDQVIAGLLWYGTWFASALIAAGLFLQAVGPLPASLALPFTGYGVMKAGIAVFIFLPVARVALMLTIFLRERDYVYTVIAALVLAIIAAGIVVEM